MTGAAAGWRTAMGAALLAGLMGWSSRAAADAISPVGVDFDVPRVTGLVADGEVSDWAGRGLAVGVMTDVDGGYRRPADFDPRLWLGWDERGLWVRGEVRDDVSAESDNDRRLFEGDSVELFVGSGRGVHDYYMWLASPGGSGDGGGRRVWFDERGGGPEAASLRAGLEDEAAFVKVDGGYRFEVCLPWANLEVSAEPGREVSFQAYVMDRDPGEAVFRVAWYPGFDTHENRTESMMTLRLSEEAGPATKAVVRGRFRSVKVVADPEFAGQVVSLRRGDIAYSQRLYETDGRAAATIELKMPAVDELLGEISVELEGQEIDRIWRGGAESLLAEAMAEGQLTFVQQVFSGEDFPSVEFQKPELVRGLIGDFVVRPTFYDAGFTAVDHAASPGRYGAVVTVEPAGGGRGASRFFTLFRTPPGEEVADRAVPDWMLPDFSAISLPGGGEVSSAGVEDSPKLDEADAVGRAGAWERRREGGSGQEADDQEADLRDQRWWVLAKRQIYGYERWPRVWPQLRRVSVDESGPMLREGTPEEAGLDAAVIAALEAICDRWLASNGGQGFTICIARGGVAFFHRAYGEANGAAVTVDSPANVQSVTKPITGALLMLFMDRQMIDLDAPIGRYLPRLREVDVPTPWTLRMLVTHTSGLTGKTGDEERDLEERVAEVYPSLSIPVSHLYGGRGYAVAVKALEAITGRPYPDLYRELLLEPLDLKNTEVTNSHNGAWTTAWDLATLGQLMLNGGTYGQTRFFRPETLDAAKPQAIDAVLGSASQKTWGIGLWGSRDAERWNFIDGAFGHNSSNSSFFRVDPRLELVMTVASFESQVYLNAQERKKIFEAIEANVASPSRSGG